MDDNQADILNVSFGACEQAFGIAGNQYIMNLWQQAAAQGIAVTVSSGDSGSAGCDDPNSELKAQYGLAVNGIASTPYNIAVGGTDYDALYGANFPTSFTTYVDVTNTLPNHRSALSYVPEEPWNNSTYPNTSIAQNVPLSAKTGVASDDNIVGGGGGVSSVYPAPAWQKGFGTGTARNVPDVSFLAGNGFYGAVWGICTNVDSIGPDCTAGATGNSFNLTGVGGTSAAAPAFAGMLALAQQKAGTRLGQAATVLYALARTKYSSVFHDVLTGDNSVGCVSGSPNCSLNPTYSFLTGYNAGTGYDEASGLGSVDATQMANAWIGAGLVATTSALQLNGASTPLSITHGQSVTVNATVAGSGGTPTGVVALVDSLSPATLPNAGAIADYTLTAGAASGTTTSLPGGTYQASAHYGGDTAFAESDSNSISVTVAAESSTTSLKVAGYYDPTSGKAAASPYYGSIFLLDAQPYGNSASATSPNGIATGTITYKTGTTTLGTANLTSSGVAELQTGLLPGGTNSLTASFPGDASFQASTSAPVGLTVQPAPTALQVASNTPSAPVGTPVSLTATFVNAAGKAFLDSAGVAPTGTVTFLDGSKSVGTANVTGTAATATTLATGSASLTTSQLACGAVSITASYGGDSNYAASVSAGVTPSIVCATAGMTVQPASTSIQVSQALGVTVTLTPSGTLPAPTGTVTLTATLSGGSTLYTSSATAITNGTSSFTIPANGLAVGPVTLKANYSGDADYGSSTASAS
ncbi:MAG: Ig-like domain repeat protein, partial [Acidobacteriota bacterium]|nr:Ig-like domain repeat protein [Acidobacteriota bacterium]